MTLFDSFNFRQRKYSFETVKAIEQVKTPRPVPGQNKSKNSRKLSAANGYLTYRAGIIFSPRCYGLFSYTAHYAPIVHHVVLTAAPLTFARIASTSEDDVSMQYPNAYTEPDSASDTSIRQRVEGIDRDLREYRKNILESYQA